MIIITYPIIINFVYRDNITRVAATIPMILSVYTIFYILITLNNLRQ